jgi:hypothetical protein
MNNHNTSRITHIYGSMNSIYIDQSRVSDQRFIRVKGQVYQEQH